MTSRSARTGWISTTSAVPSAQASLPGSTRPAPINRFQTRFTSTCAKRAFSGRVIIRASRSRVSPALAINSGGASGGASDVAQAVRTAGINKRAGGTRLISGRKELQPPMEEGVELLSAIQDVFLCEEVTIA